MFVYNHINPLGYNSDYVLMDLQRQNPYEISEKKKSNLNEF